MIWTIICFLHIKLEWRVGKFKNLSTIIRRINGYYPLGLFFSIYAQQLSDAFNFFLIFIVIYMCLIMLQLFLSFAKVSFLFMVPEPFVYDLFTKVSFYS